MSDPAVKELAAQLKASSSIELDPPSLDDRAAVLDFVQKTRAQFDEEYAKFPNAEGVAVSMLEDTPVQGELYIPEGAGTEKVLLYFHGGGQVFGSAVSHRHLVTRFAKAAGIRAWSMDYAMAPEAPFPGSMDSAVTIYRHMLEVGLKAENIIVAGDSGGGNLVMSMIMALKAKKITLPGGIFLISPLLDSKRSHPTHQLLKHKEPWVNEAISNMTITLVANGIPLDNPYLSPVYGDLDNLPPLLIHVGTDEVLLGDSLTLANKAAIGGADVTLRVYKDMFHAWHIFHPVLTRDAVGAIEEAGAWMAAVLAGKIG